MRRVTLAMTLGFGLVLVGCGETAPTADEAAKTGTPPAPASTPPDKLPPAEKEDIRDDGPGSSGGLVPGYTAPPGSTGPGNKGAGQARPRGPEREGRRQDRRDARRRAQEGRRPGRRAQEGRRHPPPSPRRTTPRRSSAWSCPPRRSRPSRSCRTPTRRPPREKVCPVGEDEDGKSNHLGAMGKPIKKEIKGKTVYLCCELRRGPRKESR